MEDTQMQDKPDESSETPSSVFDDDSSESDEVDADVLESHTSRKRKNRRAKKKALEERNKISKIVKSGPLPHQAGALSSSVTQFIRHMLGMANSKSPLPSPPSKSEIAQWANLVDARRETLLKKVNAKPTMNLKTWTQMKRNP
ncbi:hypothetical protein PGT21_001012 [Puccinia graminis f. sp. tritici]|uniref:Ribosome biogenesis protein SLX9 n=1 Tax=Puccinia graminis f. sp. tritici TaxID=56615 RepID=A0A5B0LJC0_PUCGR|nr:hypothetical protein PGT21_001012 [Puccinia graminis f. sp. tritici]